MVQLPRTLRTVFFHLHTRRSLNFPSGPHTSNSNLRKGSRMGLGSTTKDSIVHIPISSNRMEVTVHKAYEEYPMSKMSSHPSSDAQLADKPPHGLGSDDNV